MADDVVVPLRPLPKGIKPTSTVNASVVSTLQRYLQQAKKGEITSLAVAFVRPNHEIMTAWSSGDGRHQLLAAISMLQFEYARDTVE